MKRLLKTSTVFSLAFLFTVAVWCGGLGAPGSPFASTAPGCSPTGSASEGAGCEHPVFVCAPGSSFLSVANSVQTHDFSKNAQFPTIGVVLLDLSDWISLAPHRLSAASLTCP